jgi:hypothetical protein
LRDDEASWPAEGSLKLDQFVYQDLVLHDVPTAQEIQDGTRPKELPCDVRKRVSWLKIQSDTMRSYPQPWVQLSRFRESANSKREARLVIYEYRRLKARKHHWAARPALIAFALLEEDPSRILFSIAFTLLYGTVVFGAAGPTLSGAMITTARAPSGEPVAGAALAHYPRFQPLIYTLENAVPLVKLGMDEKWTPDPAHAGKSLFPQNSYFEWTKYSNSYGFLTASRWAIILLGWFQAAVLGAAITSRFKL